jgi:hypothetical protein
MNAILSIAAWRIRRPSGPLLMPKTRIFLSHSSHTAENDAIVDGLDEGLRGQGFHVFLDHSGEIQAGDEWDLRINQWMAECHGAVILFSKDALKSSWVKKEAAILTWRKRLDRERFFLTGVLLDGVTPEEIDADPLYKALRVTDFQFVRDCWREDDPVGTVACALERLNTVLPATTDAETPFDRVRQRVGKVLQKAADADELEDAWNALPAERRPAWCRTPGERFDDAISRYLFRNNREPLSALRAVLNCLPDIGKAEAMKLLGYVQPLWVDSESAGVLSNAQAKGQPCGLSLNSGYFKDFTAKHYARRAWLGTKPTLIWLNGQETTLEEMTRTIVAAFDDPEHPIDFQSARAVKQFVAYLREQLDEIPVVLLSPPGASPPDEALISAVKAEFPGLAILVGLPIDGPTGLPGLHALPAMDVELEQYQDYERRFTQRFLKDHYDNESDF